MAANANINEKHSWLTRSEHWQEDAELRAYMKIWKRTAPNVKRSGDSVLASLPTKLVHHREQIQEKVDAAQFVLDQDSELKHAIAVWVLAHAILTDPRPVNFGQRLAGARSFVKNRLQLDVKTPPGHVQTLLEIAQSETAEEPPQPAENTISEPIPKK